MKRILCALTPHLPLALKTSIDSMDLLSSLREVSHMNKCFHCDLFLCKFGALILGLLSLVKSLVISHHPPLHSGKMDYCFKISCSCLPHNE